MESHPQSNLKDLSLRMPCDDDPAPSWPQWMISREYGMFVHQWRVLRTEIDIGKYPEAESAVLLQTVDYNDIQ